METLLPELLVYIGSFSFEIWSKLEVAYPYFNRFCITNALSYHNLFLNGIRFKDNGNSIFQYTSDKNSENSYNTGGKNNGQSVAVMNPPKSNYIKEEKYAYRKITNGDYIYAVFRKNTFIWRNSS
jgi:hypothetical protein